MHFDVVVIGGGATGTAVFRDMAMRGLRTALIERSRIAEGTTKHSHQNLVGGMRYVVKDPNVARDCAQENWILSHTAPEIMEEKRGYFLGFRNDYVERAIKSARSLGVLTKELDVAEIHREIPSVNRDIDIAIQTEDRNIDATAFCKLNCLSAIDQGGILLEMTNILDIEKNETFTIRTDGHTIEASLIVNAAGPWVNSVASMLDCEIPLIYSQGTVIVQRTLSDRSIQYLRDPGGGDAYIVHGDHAWLGTTSTTIPHPRYASPEGWAEGYLKDRFSPIIPGVRDQPSLRLFVGVRPLMATPGFSRDFQILEPLPGFITVVGGKLTTARLMGELTSDHLCRKLDTSKVCRTATTTLNRNYMNRGNT